LLISGGELLSGISPERLAVDGSVQGLAVMYGFGTDIKKPALAGFLR
jgi:hypothetical protein